MTGSVHFGPMVGPPIWTSQQIWLPVQHALPQQVPAQPGAVHAGTTQVPWHSNLGAEHCVPHPPQLCGSFCSFTQTPLQQLRPNVQAGLHAIALPVVVEAPVDMEVPVVPVEVEPVAAAVPFVVVPLMPPEPLVTVVPQPRVVVTRTLRPRVVARREVMVLPLP